MPNAAPFLAAIRAAPDDDAPRLIYADWLDEHGQAERAEFIRVQCELARRKSPKLRKREAELLAKHHDAFAGTLAAPGLRFVFHRGFITAFGHTGVFMFRNRKSGVDYSFRFFPDGVVIEDAFGTRPLRELAAEFRRKNRDYDRGKYRFTSDERSAGVEFSFRSRETGYEYYYRGFLKGSFMHLESSDNEDKRWSRPNRYKHIPIKGLDTMSES